MNTLVWLLRAVRWVRRPPNARRVRLVLLVVAAGLLVVLLEGLDLWPEWARMENPHRPRFPKP